MNQAFTQTGGSGAISWTWTGTLPPSLSLNPASGVLSGTVTQTGNFAFTVRATDANGCVGERPYTLVVGTISCAITVPPTNLPNGTVGTTYAQVLNASGGLAPYTFTVVGGVLPPGLTSFSNGVLSGTPTQPGSFTFTVSVRDANNCTGTQTYTIVIGNTCPAITFTPNSLPNGAVNTPYNQIVTALPSGNYNYVVSGGLPLGLSLNPLSGAITGTPTSAGTYPFTIVATTTTGACSNSQFYTITITTQTNPCSVVLTPTSQTFSNAGGDGSVAITTGDRCVWVSLEDVSWIEILTSKSGVGSDVLRYHVSPNSGSARTGTFTISGQPFTITQSGNVAPPPPSLTCMNAAGLSSGAIAPDSLVTALGQDLSTSDQAQSAPPGVPATTLNGTTVQIRDSANTIRAPLFYVSKTQVNFLLPSATAPGPAIVTITNGAGVVAQTTVQVTTVAPGIFSANTDGRGSVQGNALRLRNGLVVAETPLARFDATQQRWVGEPLDVSRSDEQVIVQLYGTGLRARSSLANVIVTLGGIVVPVTAASPHVSAPGLDQLIFNVPPELSGRGEVSLVIGADGQAANFVTLTIK
ncbi:MAG: putative Ig domain-containing protein [Blastocatellia bacterium]